MAIFFGKLKPIVKVGKVGTAMITQGARPGFAGHRQVNNPGGGIVDKVLTGMDVRETVSSAVSTVSSVAPQRTLELYQQKLNLDFDRFVADDLYEPVLTTFSKRRWRQFYPMGFF